MHGDDLALFALVGFSVVVNVNGTFHFPSNPQPGPTNNFVQQIVVGSETVVVGPVVVKKHGPSHQAT
jgi:hypothetical protein